MRVYYFKMEKNQETNPQTPFGRLWLATNQQDLCNTFYNKQVCWLQFLFQAILRMLDDCFVSFHDLQVQILQNSKAPLENILQWYRLIGVGQDFVYVHGTVEGGAL